MIVQDFLAANTTLLHKAGIETARLDCLVLLEDVLGKDRAVLLAHPETAIDPAEIVILNNYITQRKTHRPLAYIRGRSPFFGRNFAVNTNVLIPRPETEIMIELLKRTSLPAHPRIADIGTGSGCLGITAALELPHSAVLLCDIDASALQVAQTNARSLGANVSCMRQDLLQGIVDPIDVILANLPYVPVEYPINAAAAFEPKQALFAGADGLDVYRTFWQQVASLPQPPMHIFTESLPHQHAALGVLANNAAYQAVDGQGLIQHFRQIGRQAALSR